MKEIKNETRIQLADLVRPTFNSFIFVGLFYSLFHFRDTHHIFIYLIGDIAFVFLEVLLVTLILHQLLRYREKKAMLNKLNMVIGAFFSEVGGELYTAPL